VNLVSLVSLVIEPELFSFFAKLPKFTSLSSSLSQREVTSSFVQESNLFWRFINNEDYFLLLFFLP